MPVNVAQSDDEVLSHVLSLLKVQKRVSSLWFIVKDACSSTIGGLMLKNASFEAVFVLYEARKKLER